ncbi:MAG: D-aminoacylase [Cytophagales bacterium]|nr:D-aminoacylase [Cytophagales bacterium]
MKLRYIGLFTLLSSITSCQQSPDFDVIIKGGTIYDGTGSQPFIGDIAIKGDTIAAIGNLKEFTGHEEWYAQGLAVSPGFINMLSWATETLMVDGRSESDIRQGVTLEVFGEGWSMGPLNEQMKKEVARGQNDYTFDITWTSLGEYLTHLEEKGVSTNVASFVGATTIRIHVLGYDNRQASQEELEEMKKLVAEAMAEGAMGLGSSLIYAPAFYASTEELIALCEVVASYGGMYISHLRSEGNQLMEAVDEFLLIARKAKIPAEIYHLKAGGEKNWWKMDSVIAKIEGAQRDGLKITANMYTYTAGATGLDAAMPPWVQEGGHAAWVARLKDPDIRRQVIKEIKTDATDWENLYYAAGTPEKVILVGFKNDSLKYLTGKSVAEVAVMYGKSPEETMIDLVINDDSRVETVYFLMSEKNIARQIGMPWVSFGSDAGSMSPQGFFLKQNPHPRAYGNFARLLGRYVREKNLISLEEAVRRLTSLPAENLKIKKRGLLKVGNYADVVVFNPETITDLATFNTPHQLAVGVVHVFVNGEQVLKDGIHTGATPGRVVWGPGN